MDIKELLKQVQDGELEKLLDEAEKRTKEQLAFIQKLREILVSLKQAASSFGGLVGFFKK